MEVNDSFYLVGIHLYLFHFIDFFGLPDSVNLINLASLASMTSLASLVSLVSLDSFDRLAGLGS